MYNLVFLRDLSIPESGEALGRHWPESLRGKTFPAGAPCPEMEYPERRDLIGAGVLGRPPPEEATGGAVHHAG